MFHKVVIPVTLCIVIIMMYILVGAVMFHKWEDWDLVSSAYFCFITLTTVKITTTTIIITLISIFTLINVKIRSTVRQKIMLSFSDWLWRPGSHQEFLCLRGGWSWYHQYSIAYYLSIYYNTSMVVQSFSVITT